MRPGITRLQRTVGNRVAHQLLRSNDARLHRAPCETGVLTDTRCRDAQGAGRPAGISLERFDEEKHALKPTHAAQIAAFTTAWTTAGAKDAVVVHGFASCDGNPNFNVQLSCARAEAVKAALVARGITTSITTVAHGETDEFGASLAANRRAIIESVAPPPPPPPPALCPTAPTATPGDCLGRNGGYCAAASCFPGDPWLQCVCNTSLQICRAINAFNLIGVEGRQLETCIELSVAPPADMGVKVATGFKGKWFLDTNQCIWGHWREALDALHDPARPIPAGVTGPWKTAIDVCRSKGIASADCCKAQVDAEQHAIDTCNPYDSRRFGSLPTDIPGSKFCSLAAQHMAPKPEFSGDFGSVADRIKHGLKLCCP